MSNHPRRRSEGRLPIEPDAPAKVGFFTRLFGGGTKDPNAPVAVATVDNRAEAELLAGFLRDKGIRAVVSADDEGGLAPNIAAMRRVRVLVRGVDAARAQELIDETA